MNFCKRMLLAVLLLLSGCESCGPYRVAWYIDRDPSEPKVQSTNEQKFPEFIFLALVNDGTEPSELLGVRLNSDKTGHFGWFAPLGAAEKGETFSPGGVRILRMDAFKNVKSPHQRFNFDACEVPARVALMCTKGSREIEIGAKMPSSLHDDWILKCKVPKLTAPA